MPRSLTANKMNLVGRPSVNGLSYIQKGSENRTGFKILNRKSQLCPRMYACRPWTSHIMLRNSSIQDGCRISASKILPRCYANASCLHCYYRSSLWLLFASPSVSLSSSSFSAIIEESSIVIMREAHLSSL